LPDKDKSGFMNRVPILSEYSESETARRRLLAVKGDPFLYADWDGALFLNYLVEPRDLQTYVPAGFDLDLYQGRGCVSVVAVTMRNFKPYHSDPFAFIVGTVREQRFLNFRTYVHHGSEPGALFLHGWLSKPYALPCPSGMMGLPCGFVTSAFGQGGGKGEIRGRVTSGRGRFSYQGSAVPQSIYQLPAPGSLAEFAMERYTGYFSCRKTARVFRAWHPPWLQSPVDVNVEDDSLLREKFPWWKDARLAGAHFAPGFKRVWLGKAHRLPESPRILSRRHTLSRLFEMP
jgi:uncharacterized protein YqjF (DUF2071 family)